MRVAHLLVSWASFLQVTADCHKEVSVTAPNDEVSLLQTSLHHRQPLEAMKKLLDRASTATKKAAPGERQSLAQIMQKIGTDKMWRHGYHRYYEKQLAPYRDIDGARVIEIGADTGVSLGAWMEYFKNPEVVQGVAFGVDPVAAKQKACDIMPDSCPKLGIYSLDQGDITSLASLIQDNPKGWDVVIDDGSHYPQHQLISFQRLWPNVRPGGLYAIEDIETSYVEDGQVYGYPLKGGPGVSAPSNAVEHFKNLVDVVNRKHFGRPELTIFNGVDKDVESVSFGDGLIFIQKKPADPEWDKYPNYTVFGAGNNIKTYQEFEKKVKPLNDVFKMYDQQIQATAMALQHPR